jgi:hypothetical protein
VALYMKDHERRHGEQVIPGPVRASPGSADVGPDAGVRRKFAQQGLHRAQWQT